MATLPLTLSDSQISIEQNNWFRSRVRAATSKYSNYLLATADTDADYDAKIAAGTRLAQQADMVVSTLMFSLSGDSEVIAAGPGIDDATLQALVEKTIQKFYPVTPVTPAMMMPGNYYPPAPPMPRPQ